MKTASGHSYREGEQIDTYNNRKELAITRTDHHHDDRSPKNSRAIPPRLLVDRGEDMRFLGGIAVYGRTIMIIRKVVRELHPHA